jgi:phosphomannomutase
MVFFIELIYLMKKIVLFDVDGTLAESTRSISEEMKSLLLQLSNKCHIGIVGGGSYDKITEQLNHDQELISKFQFICSENGIMTYQNDKLIHKNSIKEKWSEDFIQGIINYLLTLTAELKLPYKRGSFIRFRNGMLYYTPIGSDCSWEERIHFSNLDKEKYIRKLLVENILKKFKNKDIDVRLGGMIGIGIHPLNWDKTYVLQFLNDYQDISYIGDRYHEDGNDYPLLNHPRVKGYNVDSPEDTKEIINLFMI